MKRGFHLLGQAALLVLTWAVIFEIGFRLQQYLGPLYDLEMAGINLNWQSDVVNHQPTAEDQNLCIYGDATGFSYKRSFDANGIRITDDTAQQAGCGNPVSVLFLGDSFMEGYDDKNTLPHHVAKYFKTERGTCLKTYNAGYTSYSPAIFVPQAKKLLPVLRPDYIVVDVDETDLYDDFARYRELIVRNERGQNVGVKASPIGRECSTGLMEARKHPLYLMRFAAKLWHSFVHMPAVVEKNRSDFTLFSYSQDHGSRSRTEICRAAAEFQEQSAGAGRGVEGLHQGRQPGAVHLSPAPPAPETRRQGRLWNNLVSSSVQKICVANDFHFFNATEALKQRSGSRPERFYWGGNDMHFSHEGLAEYSAAVAAFMASAMIPKD